MSYTHWHAMKLHLRTLKIFSAKPKWFPELTCRHSLVVLVSNLLNIVNIKIQVTFFLEKVTQRSSVCTRQTQEENTREIVKLSVDAADISCSVRCVSAGGGPTQEWESTCSYQAFRHATLVAKIHRSLYIKFLQLTWHTAVNQSMKGKLICCSLSLSLSSCLLVFFFHNFNVLFLAQKKGLDCFTSLSVEVTEGRTT